MPLAAFELNDQSLLIQAEDQSRAAEPGFARLTAEGIVTGEHARAVAWREPQHMYNQYWCHLNQTPLANRHRFARHNGDIAFAQLRKIWTQAGEPDELIVLPAGSVTRDQLSLLLGLVGALPARVTAVMDSALAACLDTEGETVFVDMHLHETVCTVCRSEQGTVRIVDQEVFPGVGMTQVQNSVARHISDLLIANYRFDPLHASTTEQAIYEQIPHWLTRLGWEQDVSIKLDSDKGELPCILRKEAVEKLIGERIASLVPLLEEWPDGKRVLSHHTGLLAGLSPVLSEARVARRTAATRRVLMRHTEIVEQSDELVLLRSFTGPGTEQSISQVNGEALATHLLCGEIALPLARPLSIHLSENGPVIRNAVDKDAALTLVLKNRSLEALHGAPDGGMPGQCRPGELIRVGGYELKLIRVPEA
jgi:hypothetical protein